MANAVLKAGSKACKKFRAKTVVIDCSQWLKVRDLWIGRTCTKKIAGDPVLKMRTLITMVDRVSQTSYMPRLLSGWRGNFGGHHV